MDLWTQDYMYLSCVFHIICNSFNILGLHYKANISQLQFLLLGVSGSIILKI